MQIKIKKLDDRAQLPVYATTGAACFDLHTIVDDVDPKQVSVMGAQTIMQGELAGKGAFEQATVYRTGLAFEIPEGYVMLVYSRSGHGFKHGVRLANCVGVIDSDYRGEVMVKLHNDSRFAFTVYNGDRIAQAMIIPVQQVQFELVTELSSTERGSGGLGSTGV